MPYPCNGPIACSVFSTISASVPCHTSFLSFALSPIVLLGLLSVPMGNPYGRCHSPYGKAIEETRPTGNLFPPSLRFFWSCPHCGPILILALCLESLPSLTLPQLLTSLMRLLNIRSGVCGSKRFTKRSLHAFCLRAPVPFGTRVCSNALRSSYDCASNACAGWRTAVFRDSRSQNRPGIRAAPGKRHYRDGAWRHHSNRQGCHHPAGRLDHRRQRPHRLSRALRFVHRRGFAGRGSRSGGRRRRWSRRPPRGPDGRGFPRTRRSSLDDAVAQ